MIKLRQKVSLIPPDPSPELAVSSGGCVTYVQIV